MTLDGEDIHYTLSEDTTMFHSDASLHIGGHSNVYELTDGFMSKDFTGMIEEVSPSLNFTLSSHLYLSIIHSSLATTHQPFELEISFCIVDFLS